jgi:UTP--glucose-1-phosphate uridylyltransferase
MDIIKTIIPAAGLGTRFLPFTKAVPKEMLPLLNKPAIQYNIEEALHADVKNILMIVSKNKQAIANHFDTDLELEMVLKERGELEILNNLKKISKDANFSYIRQSEPLGLGHAIWLARHSINKEYFGVQLPDEIIISKTPGLAQLIKVARQEKATVVGVQEVPLEMASSYGIVAIKKQITPNLFQVSHLVEKPDQKDAPSNLALIGRYVLSHKVFQALETIETDLKGELQLTDAISQMMFNNEKVFAYKIQGIRYDIGNPIGWLKALIGCALQDPHYHPHIRKFLEDKELMDSFMYQPFNLVENTL